MIEVAIQALSLLSFAALPPPEVIELFELREFHSAQESNPERNVLCRLFRPVNPQPAQRYPLIVWLHGYGEDEFKLINCGQLHHTVLMLPSVEAAKQAPFYLLALQCPADQRGFFGTAIGSPQEERFSPEPGEVVMEVVERLLREEPIDPARVTLVGISGGATAAWEMAMRYPYRFAALAPLGGGGPDLVRLERIVDVPVWAFHGGHDSVTPIQYVREAIPKLQALGGKAHLTEVAGVGGGGHDCHTAAFGDYWLDEWLLAQRRGIDRPAPLEGRWDIWVHLFIKKALATGVHYYLPLPVCVVLCWFLARRQKLASKTH